jgi:ATP-dependent Clp protease ATP-binding subunit ClpA
MSNLHMHDQPMQSDSTRATGASSNRPLWADLVRLLDLTGFFNSDSQHESPFSKDPAYLRFFDSLAKALCRSAPRHTIVIRDRGVGERSVLMDFAQTLKGGKYPRLETLQIHMADFTLISPDQIPPAVQGFFECYFPQENTVVCVDGLATILSAANRLAYHRTLQYLSQTRCRIIGLLTEHEYQELLAPDVNAAELFSVLGLHEPEEAVAKQLLRHFSNGLERQYNLRIEDNAIGRSVALARNYILHERLPTKAIKILRSVCDDISFERATSPTIEAIVKESQIISKIAEISGISTHTLDGIGDGTDYGESLRQSIVGQEEAVNAVATELSLINAGFVDSGKPASVMFFMGQTGTGKTEMAKALARLYSSSKRLKTFTLGNFSEPHSVSGIIGVPPGYVGHDQGGRLINDLNADPYGVFLLDEADKAHPDVLQPFLNLFDEGWIYDQRGKKAYADRAIFVLTTNVGQRQMADMFRDGKSLDDITHVMKETLSKTKHSKSNRPVFSPEFLARLKRIVLFRPLDQIAMLGITKCTIGRLNSLWKEQRQKSLIIDPMIIDSIATKAYAANEKAQGREGGRIVRKLVSEHIEAPIQKAIASNPHDYRGASKVVVNYRNGRSNIDEITVVFSAVE